MELITKVNSAINDVVWGPIMLVLLVGTGVFISFRLNFLQVSKIKLWWSGTFGKLKRREKSKDDVNITPFQAVTTALASTVGTGNIIGVATAIVSGGPGAVFWMWVSAFFGMMTKYAEIVLAVKFRETDEDGKHYGGPMYYIEKGLNAKWLAVIFAVFGALACFGIGNMTQANSIASTVQDTLGVSPLITGIVIAVIAFLVIVGGIKRIATVTEKLVPFMAVFYILGGIIVLLLNITKIPAAFGTIFANAFTLKAAGGGVVGYTISKAMRFGFARGVFSNEAGLGSAPIAHASSSAKEPVEQALWGIFEVFVDTIVICTITSLVVVISGLYADGALEGAPLTIAAFSTVLGPIASVFMSISIVCFALSTILGWSYYGERCISYITKDNKAVLLIYKCLFIILIVVGSVGGLEIIWAIADTLNGLMAIPNLIAILGLQAIILKETKLYLNKRSATKNLK